MCDHKEMSRADLPQYIAALGYSFISVHDPREIGRYFFCDQCHGLDSNVKKPCCTPKSSQDAIGYVKYRKLPKKTYGKTMYIFSV